MSGSSELEGEIARRFFDDGYYFPVDVLTRDEVAAHRGQLELLQPKFRHLNLGNNGQVYYPHVICQFANQIAHHSRLLEVVQILLGPDVFVWSSALFIKEPHTESYVSWHQDMRYFGLDDVDGQVNAWVALGPVTIESGCLRFVPRSHKANLLPHRDTFDPANVLSRGQTADVEISDDDAIHVALEPGQASFHHGNLLHASSPNRSGERRIGLSINYVAAHVRQVVAKEDFGMLVLGSDRFGHFQHVPRPSADMTPESMMWHRRILDAQNNAMLNGIPFSRKVQRIA